MTQLTLKDIPLGNIDAKNEVLSGAPEEIERFLAAYVTPPALVIDKFVNRQKYYVVGLKGTGKTALLRYISLQLERDDAVSSFVLFKSDLDEDLKKDFSKAARVQVVEENSSDLDGDDFEAVWRWFIYRKIALAITQDEARPFQDNAKLGVFVGIVNSEVPSQAGKSALMRLVPAIRKGNIEISQSPKLGLEFEWDEKGRAKVNFNELVRKADQAFSELTPDSGRFNIFFDELELNYATTKQYQRDSRLVRDLVVSIEKINGISKKRGFPLCLYAAIRSEVLVSVESLGKEINKPIADFGAPIVWNRPGLSAEQQPLLVIIERRINSARQNVGLPELDSDKLWSAFFPQKIHGQNPQIYILHNSWYRPRDIVRLLMTVQDQYPDERSFNTQGLEAVRKTYSTASWVELTEELKTKYKAAEIDGIKYIFYGFKQISTLAELDARAGAIAVDHVEVQEVLRRVGLRGVLKDLYRIGVIGNINPRTERMRFSFRGDDEILFEESIFVHNALKAHLSI